MASKSKLNRREFMRNVRNAVPCLYCPVWAIPLSAALQNGPLRNIVPFTIQTPERFISQTELK